MSTTNPYVQEAQQDVERAEYVAGLRAFADFIEANPAAPLPIHIDAGFHCTSRDEFVGAVRAMGEGRKNFSDGYATVSRFFGPVELRYQAARAQVCERVVVGTETVEVPDPNAPKVTVEREKVEWRCEPLLTDREAA